MTYDELDHLDDYRRILARLEAEKNNYTPEIGMRTMDNINDNIDFFKEKIAYLER
jgi:hypothetical protein